jgi:hypothetical protein
MMAERRPIDALRNSGKSMQIGTDGDDSAISEMIPIGETLYLVKERGTYAMQLADQIDPKRINAAIPDTQQRVLAIGSTDPIVARTFLTAHTLFDKNFLGSSFDQEKGLKLALELLKDIAVLVEMRADLESAGARARASWEAEKPERGAISLPAIGNVKQRFDAFAQKTGHVVKTLERIAKLFYDKELKSKWIDSLTSIAADRYGDDSPFAQWMKNARPFLLYVLDLRNLIEHHATDKFIKVSDFRLMASGEIALPSVEIVRPGEPTATASITILMKKVADHLVSVSEVLMAHLCDVNVQPVAGMSFHVFELSPEHRSNKSQRFYYGYYNGEQIVRIG